MRVVTYLITISTALALGPESASAILDVPMKPANPCREPFDYYGGLCTQESAPNGANYHQASTTCSNDGSSFAPSIHSWEDFKFWREFVQFTEYHYLGDPRLSFAFWLDAYCPIEGQPYVWGDDTPTDFMGPNDELKQCNRSYGFHMHLDGLRQAAYNSPAVAVCVYDPHQPAVSSPCLKRPDYKEYYIGLCIYTSDMKSISTRAITYNEAVEWCNSVGVSYAPSFHSREEFAFWSEYAGWFQDYSKHFWLDAYCAMENRPYVWRDGTITDYMGPNDELLLCEEGYGLIMTTDGLVKAQYSELAPSLCIYNPHTLPPTTLKPPTNGPKPVDGDYCPCDPSSVYLDIIFIVDTSAGMPRDVVGDATATIQSTLYGLTFGTSTFQSNVAALAYAETIQTVVNFGDVKTYSDISRVLFPYLGGNSLKTADAIKQATTMITSSGRKFTRGAIVLFTNSFNEFDAPNIQAAAGAFKNDGGIFITIDYSDGPGIQNLGYIASPGYYIQGASTDSKLDSDILYSLCDANCFCRVGLHAYNAPNSRGRDVPNSCYHVSDFTAVYYAAQQNCQNQKGIVATIHDDDKNFFMTSLFAVKVPFWIGFERKNDKGEVFEWADGSNDPYTNWAPSNPVDGMDCVYGQQQTGFNAPWFSAPCASPVDYSMTYACQVRPCSSEYDCSA